MRNLENILRVKKIVSILLLISCQYTYAQKHPAIDSLENVLKNDKLSDSLKLTTELALSTQYQFLDFEKSLRHANNAVTLSEKINTPWAKTSSYQNLAFYYTLAGDFSTALEYDNISLQHSLQTRDTSMISAAYNFVGSDYYDIGEYDDAYFYFTQAYGIAKKVNDSARMTIALHNVGCVFKEMEQFERAIDHIKLSRKISHAIGDEYADAYYFYELGDIQLHKQQYDSALISLLASLENASKMAIDELKPKIYTKIARTFLLKEDYTSAFTYYDSTYSLYRKTNNQFGLAEVYLGRGIVLLKQGNYDQAKILIERSQHIAHTINARVLEIECQKSLYTLAEQQARYDEALKYFKRYKSLEDSLFSQEMLQKLFRDQVRFETESKDLQIARLSQTQARNEDQLKRQQFIRNILVVVFALSVILLVTVYRSGQRRKQINKLLLQHHEEMEKRSEELERLNQVKDKFFSIISHDLRSPINTLSGILDIMAKQGLSQEEFEEQTRELRIRFDHTRTLLNNLLDWTLLQMEKLSLQPAKIELHKITNDNIEILTSIQTKHINLINQIPEHAQGYADSNTINLVMRNLLTNAIKFTNDGGEVVIAGEETPHEWILSVHDNGVGIRPEVQQILFDKTAPYTTRGTANEKGTGLGLILCKEFIEKNGGRIWVQSSEGKGSTFFFTVLKP